MLEVIKGNGGVRGENLENHGIEPHKMREADVGPVWGAVPFVIFVQTVAGTASTSFFGSSGAHFKFRIIEAWGYMTGAGASTDTIKIDNATDSDDITNAVDVASHGDNDKVVFDIDNAFIDIEKGDDIQTTQVSDALVRVYIMGVPIA